MEHDGRERGKQSLAEGEWTTEWVFARHAMRFPATFAYIRDLIDRPGYRILDLGGSQFADEFAASDAEYVMLDLEEPMADTQGGYFGHENGMAYDGKTLPFGPDRFDLILVGFVLHHAAQHTIGLLHQIRRISTKRVLVLEDLASPDYPRDWLDRNARHQPGGMFRDDPEWRALFDMIGFDLKAAIIIRLPGDPGDRPYRVMYDLVPRRIGIQAAAGSATGSAPVGLARRLMTGLRRLVGAR